MKAPNRVVLSITIVAVLLLGCAGCGSSGSNATEFTPTAIKNRLQDAGYDVRSVNGSADSPRPLAALVAERVHIAIYRTPQQAKTAHEEDKGLAAAVPDSVLARVMGTRAYSTTFDLLKGRSALTSTERATFDKIVATAEGQGQQ